jgi:hypothetical protein
VGLVGLFLLVLPFLWGDVGSSYFLIRADYVLWVSFILVCVGVVLDLFVYRGVSLYSSIFIEFIGFLLVCVGRFISVVVVLVGRFYNFYVGGFLVDYAVLGWVYSLMMIGSILSVGEMIMHWVKGPHVFSASISFDDFLKGIYNFVIGHVVLFSFLFGFLVRFLPEVFWWPMLIGPDTVDYAAQLRDIVVKPELLFGVYMRDVPPLLYWLLYPFGLFIDPVLLFKFYPSVMFGLLISLMVLYSRRVLNLRGWVLLSIVIVGSFSLLLLRLSWDLQKQLLSTVLVLGSLIVIDGHVKNDFGLFILGPLLILMGSLASEFGGAIGVIISFFVVLNYFVRYVSVRNKKDLLVIMVYLFVLFVSYFLVMWYLSVRTFVSSNPVMGSVSSVIGASSEMLWVYPYIVINFGFLFPLFLIGLGEYWSKAYVSIFTVIVLFLLAITPWITPHIGINLWERILMVVMVIVIPVSLSELKLIKSWLLRFVLIMLIITPGFYATMSPSLNDYNSLLVSELKGMPAGLVPVPGEPDYNELLTVGKIVSGLDLKSTPLLIMGGAWRFIHLEIRNPNPESFIAINDWPSVWDVACIAFGLNKTKLYVLFRDFRFMNDSVKVSLINSANVTSFNSCPYVGLNKSVDIMLRFRTIYNGTNYKLILVDVSYVTEK